MGLRSAIVGCLFLASCTGQVVVPGSNLPCSVDNPTGACAEGFFCDEGQCVHTSGAAACAPGQPFGRCPSGEACVDGSCRVIGPGEGCAPDNPNGYCPGGQICVAGACYGADELACAADNPQGLCPTGERCDAGNCVPVDDGSCSVSNPQGSCPGVEQCVGGECQDPVVPPCTPSAPDGVCPATFVCITGTCVPIDSGSNGCSPTRPDGLCPDGMECDGGICRTIPDAQACSPENSTGSCDAGGECVAGVCEIPECDSTHPFGACAQADWHCVSGVCEPLPCGAHNPAGECPAGQVCEDGECGGCDLTCAGGCAQYTVCDTDTGSATCGQCLCDTSCGTGCPSANAVCDSDTGSATCGQCLCDTSCGSGCVAPEEICDVEPTSPTCGECVCDTTCAGACVGDGDICDDDTNSPTCGECICDVACGSACTQYQTCDANPGSPTCGQCQCDTGCGTGCIPGEEICDTNLASATCGQCLCDITCAGACPGACDSNPSSPGCGTCTCDTTCGNACVANEELCDSTPGSATCGQCLCDASCGGLCTAPDETCDSDTGSATCGECICDTTCGGVNCAITARVCDTDTGSGTCGACICASSEVCAVSNECCQGTDVCVADRYCRPPCPGDNYCGSTAQVCCPSNFICGPELTCIRDCPVNQDVCGVANDACCATNQACIYDVCLDVGVSCTEFFDCGFNEYCEPTLGVCLPIDIGGGEDCRFPPPDDLFDPVIEWHFLGVQNVAGTWQLCDVLGDYSDANCFANVETAPMVADLDKLVSTADLVYQSPWATQPTTFPAGKAYPEVVLKSYATDDFNDHTVVVLDGRDGTLKAAIPGHERGHLALANLDGDAELEIVMADGMAGWAAVDPFYVAPGTGGTICPALDTNGGCEVSWTRTDGPLANNARLAAPAVTDLNGDGQAEVVAGSLVLDGRDGSLLLPLGTVCSGAGNPTIESLWGGDPVEGPIAAVADVDLDGVPEIVAGHNVIEITESGGVWSCTWEWTSPDIGDGFAAVANFVDNTLDPYASDPDTTNYPNDQDYPEVVVVDAGSVAILHGVTGRVMKSPVDGTTLMRFDLFDRRGGAPNVADFDGDNHIEVGFAGAGCMVVIDPDCAVADAAARATVAQNPASGCTVDPATVPICTDDIVAGIGDMLGVLWMDRTQDQSSAATSTSVFDFQGDGKAEVLYNDECFFRVYDGETGAVLVERPNSHRTGTEYPIVVDADGDSNSEILFVGTHDQSGGRDECNGDAAHAYLDGLDKNGNATDLYDPAFCTCGHLTDQVRCDATPGCAWSGSCAVSDSPRPDDPADICQNGTWGMWVLGDVSDLWVKTLPQWHQHTYHVTEVTVDGQPRVDWGAGNNNWDIYNNYRQNVQGFVPLNAPNMTAFSLIADLLACPPTVSVLGRVVNSGSRGHQPTLDGDLPVSFYRDIGSGWELLETVWVTEAIPPGRGVNVTYDYAIGPTDYDLDFMMVVNDDGTAGPPPVAECDPSDNVAITFDATCLGG